VLAGSLGLIKAGTEGAASNEIGFDLAAPGAGPLVEFSCGGVPELWRGLVIVPIKTNLMSSSITLKYAAAAAHQRPEGFEGQPKDILESSIGGGASVQSALVMTVTQTGKEKLEINSVI
jgi:hypothetical protein